jgi:hypothetical protein
MAPELGKVDVFDAIPDVMRYERAPFKDIAAVRSATPFERVIEDIRRTPELTSVEVTITALEQMLRSEVQRHAYSRIVIDSLTALQYFCMKGFDIVAGAQTFLRYLSDLRVTTILTVEAPLEDVETPERMLARGEIRLFRWELDDMTVRAIGVEKFRGSSHDIRLHPYRIGPTGLDINLDVTISRDTREIVRGTPLVTPGVIPSGTFESVPTTLEVLNEELRDLLLVGADTVAIRAELEGALAAARSGDSEHATQRLLRAVAIGATLPEHLSTVTTHPEGEIAHALHRLIARAESSRAGEPPVRVPEPPILTARLAKILADLQPRTEPGPPGLEPVPEGTALPGAAPSTPVPATQPPSFGSPETLAPVPPAMPPVVAEAAPPLGTTTREGVPASYPGRPSPPPLPQVLRLPEATPVDSTSPPPAAPFGAIPAPSVPRPTLAPEPAPTAVVDTARSAPSTSAEADSAPSEGAAPKRRKRPAASARKKGTPSTSREHAGLPSPASTPENTVAFDPAIPGAATPVPNHPGSGEVTPSDGPPTDTARPPGPEVVSSLRSKRRVVRKKKAPSVVGATAGPPPDDDSSAGPETTPPNDPTTTGPPPETP